jgi:hypothetical protein
MPRGPSLKPLPGVYTSGSKLCQHYMSTLGFLLACIYIIDNSVTIQSEEDELVRLGCTRLQGVVLCMPIRHASA